MRAELTFEELDLQQAELLPAREALSSVNWASVYASNTAVALNAGSWWSTATANATQNIYVYQS